MIDYAIKVAFMKKFKRGWDKWPHMFWAIDLHDVIIPGNYTRNNDDREFFPHAKEVLQWISGRKDMRFILFTSSHQDSICDIVSWLKDHNINVDYINENPECEDNDLCSFNGKFYFDILLEDKAGFEGISDWLNIKKTLIEIDQWDKKETH